MRFVPVKSEEQHLSLFAVAFHHLRLAGFPAQQL